MAAVFIQFVLSIYLLYFTIPTILTRGEWSIEQKIFRVDGAKNSLSPCISGIIDQEIGGIVQTGDIVLLKNDSQYRNHWPMARVLRIFATKHGIV